MWQRERVNWYLLGMGSEVDLHTVHLHGQTFIYKVIIKHNSYFMFNKMLINNQQKIFILLNQDTDQIYTCIFISLILFHGADRPVPSGRCV